MSASAWKNKLYYGDNLVWLRDHDHFPNESVDLIYLDPPFNSNADYNIIFKEPGGEESPAQMKAFDDTWKWDSDASEEALRELGAVRPDIVELPQWIAGRKDRISKSMAAYLAMMAIRLVELHRVLKPTGSLYLHCDTTASHYLKLILDQIFGPTHFRNEIVWRRTTSHGDWKQGAKHFGRVHDTILFYSRSNDYVWNTQFVPFSAEQVRQQYYKVDANGRNYRLVTPTAKKPGGDTSYEWKGVKPPHGRYWAYTREKMAEMDKKGLLYYSRTGQPYIKYYLDERPGVAAQSIWTEILPIGPTSKEQLPYQTQKPIALIERIIKASSNEGDIVLDPFCGCGTTVVAAHKLNRHWLGIDVTWLAIDLVEKRLRDIYKEQVRDSYVVYGNPYDVPSAQALANKNKKEFELWALSLVGAAPRERDGGVDGLYAIAESRDKVAKVVVQVKGGKNLDPGMVRDLIGTIEKEKAAFGLLITLEPPTVGMAELAVHSGSYVSPLSGKSYPRIQIRTIEQLLEGKGFALPPGGSPMKRAAPIRERGRTKRML